MSDVANSIAIERGYWLGDAFASGGSNGFGHKDLGNYSTRCYDFYSKIFYRRGNWYPKDEISVVGIGSMSGDVFGNGMIFSPKFKLLQQFHKRDIYWPKPKYWNCKKREKRLFESKDGGWAYYNKELISTGGGVFKRSDKTNWINNRNSKTIKMQ